MTEMIATDTRECGECTLCCTLGIVEYGSKPGEYCPKCNVGTGCSIYEQRPESCVQYNCLWKQQTQIPDDMRPDKIGVFFDMAPGSLIYFATVAPGKTQEIYKDWRVGAMVKKINQAGHAVYLNGKSYRPEGMSEKVFQEQLAECYKQNYEHGNLSVWL